MALKHILVHLDASPHAATRIDAAAALARHHGAFLRGLFAQPDFDGPSVVARHRSAVLDEQAKRSEALFRERTAAAGVTSDWYGLVHGHPGHIVRETIARARFADMIVLGQHDPATDALAAPDDLAEDVALHAGRPVLVIPYAGQFPVIGKHVAVAWNAEREAARALGDAMHFLAGAEAVTIISVHGLASAPMAEERYIGIIDHLALHGIPAHMASFTITDISAVDAILNRAVDDGADLLVVGAHGHYGFPFLHRGGTTRQLLRTAPLPLLLSH